MVQLAAGANVFLGIGKDVLVQKEEEDRMSIPCTEEGRGGHHSRSVVGPG